MRRTPGWVKIPGISGLPGYTRGWMMPLAEAVRQLNPRHLLTGSVEGESELLQLWIYRRERSFDLLVGSTSTSNHPRPHRNIVSQGYETLQELLEALSTLDQIYKINHQDLFGLPTTVQTAIPEQIDALARQLQFAGGQTKDAEPGFELDLSALEAQAERQAQLDADDDLQVLAD